MTEIVGGLVTIGIGVIVVAAIYQLGQAKNNITSTVTGLVKTTVTAGLFK
jgi:hypothetical protein